MNKLLVLLLLALIGYQILKPEPQYTSIKRIQSTPEIIEHAKVRSIKAPNFHCDGRRYCSQMTSREEAEYFLRNCPDTRMDGDHDGIPCENDSRF
jgi:hypothetical protein